MRRPERRAEEWTISNGALSAISCKAIPMVKSMRYGLAQSNLLPALRFILLQPTGVTDMRM